MSSVDSFRHWHWTPPGRLHLPAALRALAPRLGAAFACVDGWRRHVAFDAPIAAIALAAFLTGPWFTERPGLAAAGASAAVIDGDSLRAGSMDIRLDGIDAPELRQMCRERDGREWPCGRAAREHLRALVSRGDIACAAYTQDRYSRALAICSAGNVADLGEAMVRDGYAVNYGHFTSRYADAEAQARIAGRGMWRGGFDRPADWRTGHRRREAVGSSGR